MARNRIHVRLVALGGTATSALTIVWTLGYAVSAGNIPIVPLVLGPLMGIGTALAATRLAGHPAGKTNIRLRTVQARGAR